MKGREEGWFVLKMRSLSKVRYPCFAIQQGNFGWAVDLVLY